MMYANPSPPRGRLWIAMSEGGVGTVIRHTLGNFTLLRGDGGLLEAASGLDALAAATIGRIGCVDPLPAAAWETDGGRTVASAMCGWG
jgi:hypothetical protein